MSDPLDDLAFAASRSRRSPSNKKGSYAGGFISGVLLFAGLGVCAYIVYYAGEEKGGFVGAVIAPLFKPAPIAALSNNERQDLERMMSDMRGLLAVREFDDVNGTLTVGPLFYLADYGVKLRLCDLLLRKAREFNPNTRTLRIIDYRSNRQTGTYSGDHLDIETNPG